MIDPQRFSRRLLSWYTKHKRDLPWRTSDQTLPDPWHVFISEAMLQQTQVVTVIPYYHRFIARFPTPQSLAEAPEQEVLRLWQGLGYYSRARNLQRAAGEMVERFGGKVPDTIEQLLSLPGVGRYTAGAVASLAFGRRAPILDGNVTRVLCRLDCITDDPRARETIALLWRRAEEILPTTRVGDFNSALMELGATVCTPRNPQCLLCPVQQNCAAFAAGVQEKIPPPKKTLPTPLEKRRVYCIRAGNRYRIEQRPQRGRWAGMWQFVTLPHDAPAPGHVQSPRLLGTVKHALTHRRYEFDVYHCESIAPIDRETWVTLEELAAYPLPRPHLRIVELLQHADAKRA
jgi:A/G-specific adenine glycosylase